ncbi:NAC domain containing protein [Nitzschia inconspicua]|uniref:NAC domain containing protein n=1 Tax=Nitzschia inconspicua TaxID=303405 RepID=A0A9K3L4Y5_9STRA|nr:NAC domain containing protein [Nitzschia inconspicua]
MKVQTLAVWLVPQEELSVRVLVEVFLEQGQVEEWEQKHAKVLLKGQVKGWGQKQVEGGNWRAGRREIYPQHLLALLECPPLLCSGAICAIPSPVFLIYLTMPSVQEELAELRKRNLTKKNAENLKDAKGLSTPEQEEIQIKEKLAKTKVGVYAKEAQSNLEKGTSALDQTTDFRIKTGAAKKSDKEKQKEAAKNLQSFNQAKSNMSAKEENVPVVEDDDDVPELEEVDDVPGLEEIPDMEGGLPPGVDPDVMAAAAGENRINRAERKARRMMEKLGMKKVPGINQCTIKMGGRQGIFTIAKPDVFEKNGSYVVFGEARQGGGGLPGANAAAAASMQEQQAQAAQQLAAQAGAAADDAGVPKIEEVEEEAIDDSGVDAKDIDLVMGQAGCSRAKAVKALKDNGGDLVNAIMSLTA